MAETIRFGTLVGPVDALHWFLSDREQLWQALKELVDEHGHRGGVLCWPDVAGTVVYRLEVNDDSGNMTRGELGQHLVLVVGDRVRAYDADVFDTLRFDA